MHYARLITFTLLLSIPILAWAAIDSQSKRMASAGSYVSPDGAISSASERYASLEDYGQFGGGGSTPSGGFKYYGDGLGYTIRRNP